GAASQRDFYAGRLGYDQLLANLGVSKGFDFGLAKPVNVAAGLEYRREAFKIGAGEPASYTLGPITTAAGNSQGFPGFRPSNAIDNPLVNGSFQLIEIGTFPVNSVVARALGARPLEPETSNNYSVGFVFSHGPFELTVDAYQIDLTNRIVLSENLPNASTPAA